MTTPFDSDEPQPARRDLPPAGAWTAASIVAAGLVGTWIRLLGLDRQVLTGDELHGLNGALSRSLGEIASQWTYFGADYSVPLTLITRAAMDAGLPVDEALLRVPALLAGISMIVLLPALWTRSLGASAAALLAWLVALSPLLVLYSRIARWG